MSDTAGERTINRFRNTLEGSSRYKCLVIQIQSVVPRWEHTPATLFNSIIWSTYLTRHFPNPSLFALPNRFLIYFIYKYYNIRKCLSIFYTPAQSKKHAHTSWKGLFSLLIVTSWTSSVQDAFKLPQCSVTPKLLCCVGTATSCSASLPAEKPASQRDAPSERRLIKFWLINSKTQFTPPETTRLKNEGESASWHQSRPVSVHTHINTSFSGGNNAMRCNWLNWE